MLAAVGPRAEGVVHAGAIGGGEGPAMGEVELDLRIARHHSVKDQIVDGHRRIQRIADDVCQEMPRKARAGEG